MLPPKNRQEKVITNTIRSELTANCLARRIPPSVVYIGHDLRSLLEQALDLSERLSSRVLGQKLADGIGTPLHVVNGVLVRPSEAIGFNGVNFLHQPVCLVSELSYDHIPFSEALVAAFTVWEFTKVTPSTSVTAGARHTLHTHTMSRSFVTLLLSNSSGVTVTG